MPLSNLFNVTVTAADIYVNKTGDNSDGLTPATAFNTIADGIAALSSGQTLEVGGGTYNEVINLSSSNCPNGTSWDNATTIRAAAGETVTNMVVTTTTVPAMNIYDRQWIIIDGINFDGSNHSAGQNQGDGIKLHAGCQHIRLQNLTVANFGLDPDGTGRGGQGIIDVSKPLDTPAGGSGPNNGNEFLSLVVHNTGYLEGQDHGMYIQGHGNKVWNCEVYDSKGMGLQFFSGGIHRCNDNDIQYNNIHHNGRGDPGTQGNGILVGGNNNLIANNIVHNNRGRGLDSFFDSVNNVFANNTVYNNASTAYRTGTTADNTLFINNIFWQNGAKEDNSSNTVETTNLWTDPGFVTPVPGTSPDSNDFQLASDSPARDAGTTVVDIGVDYRGVTRPKGAAYDIGAFEYQ